MSSSRTRTARFPVGRTTGSRPSRIMPLNVPKQTPSWLAACSTVSNLPIRHRLLLSGNVVPLHSLQQGRPMAGKPLPRPRRRARGESGPRSPTLIPGRVVKCSVNRREVTLAAGEDQVVTAWRREKRSVTARQGAEKHGSAFTSAALEGEIEGDRVV